MMRPARIRPIQRFENVSHLVKLLIGSSEPDEHAIIAVFIRPSWTLPAKVCKP